MIATVWRYARDEGEAREKLAQIGAALRASGFAVEAEDVGPEEVSTDALAEEASRALGTEVQVGDTVWVACVRAYGPVEGGHGARPWGDAGPSAL